MKTKQTNSNASIMYTLRSHISAVEYTCAFHRLNTMKSLISQSSSHITIFKEIQVYKAKPS